MKKLICFLTKEVTIKALRIAFLVCVFLSIILTMRLFIAKTPKNTIKAEFVAYASEGTATPTPFQPIPPTGTHIPTPTSTPVVNQYDFNGVRFDLVDELLGNYGSIEEKEKALKEDILFYPNDAKNVSLTFYFPDGQTIKVKFLPIPYHNWMDDEEGEDFGQYCPVGSHKGCVYASDGHITIVVHSGCAGSDTLPAERLRARLEKTEICQFPKISPTGYKDHEGMPIDLSQGQMSLNLSLLLIEYVPPEEISKLTSMAARDLAENIGVENFSPMKRQIYLITSARGQTTVYSPNFASGRWFGTLE